MWRLIANSCKVARQAFGPLLHNFLRNALSVERQPSIHLYRHGLVRLNAQFAFHIDVFEVLVT